MIELNIWNSSKRIVPLGLNEIYVWFLLHTKKFRVAKVGRKIIKFCYNSQQRK